MPSVSSRTTHGSEAAHGLMAMVLATCLRRRRNARMRTLAASLVVLRGIDDDELEGEGDDQGRLSRPMLAQSLENPIKVRGTPQHSRNRNAVDSLSSQFFCNKMRFVRLVAIFEYNICPSQNMPLDLRENLVLHGVEVGPPI